MKPDPLMDPLLEGLNRVKQNNLVDEMCRRVGLSTSIGRTILSMARVCYAKQFIPADMTVVAQAISYAAKNKDRLRQ